MWLIYARNRSADTNPQINRVKWRKVRAIPDSVPAWDGDEEVVTLGRVVDAVRAGEYIGTLFQVNGHSVLGPVVIVTHDAYGRERIEVGEWPHDGQRSLFSLPEFD